MALAHAAAGRRNHALDEAEAAQKVAEEGEFDALAVEIALDRIGWLTSDGRLVEAGDLLDKVEATSTSSDNRRLLAKVAESRADILEALGDHQAALREYRTFHRIDQNFTTMPPKTPRAAITLPNFRWKRAMLERNSRGFRVAELESPRP